MEVDPVLVINILVNEIALAVQFNDPGPQASVFQKHIDPCAAQSRIAFCRTDAELLHILHDMTRKPKRIPL